MGKKRTYNTPIEEMPETAEEIVEEAPEIVEEATEDAAEEYALGVIEDVEIIEEKVEAVKEDNPITKSVKVCVICKEPATRKAGKFDICSKKNCIGAVSKL
jgi:hypothetical protein